MIKIILISFFINYSMARYCTASGCNNSSLNLSIGGKRISLYRCTLNDKDLLKKWLVKIKRENFEPNSNSRICSSHFEEDRFQCLNFSEKQLLKKDALPTVFSFKSAPKSKRTSYAFNGG